MYHQKKNMKNARKLFVMAALVGGLLPLVSSCRTSKETIRTDVKVDTIRVSDVVLKSPDIFYNLTFDEICDTVTGEIRPINNIIVKSGDTLRLWSEKNRLTLQIDLLERIVSRQRDSIQKATSVQTEKETIIKYRTPTWIWLVLAGAILTFLVSIKVWRFF